MKLEELCAAVQEARYYNERFTRREYTSAFRTYTERFGPLYMEAVRETAEVGEPAPPGPEYLLRAEILPENGSGGDWVLPSQAPGRTAAASVFAYPPGVPLWLADQAVREEDIALLASLQKTGYNLIGAEKGIFVRKQGPRR